MATLSSMTDIVLRSPGADWDHTRWEELPDDGNRYEVIDGVLYMTTVASSFHQWIVQQFLALYHHIDVMKAGATFVSPLCTDAELRSGAARPCGG